MFMKCLVLLNYDLYLLLKLNLFRILIKYFPISRFFPKRVFYGV